MTQYFDLFESAESSDCDQDMTIGVCGFKQNVRIAFDEDDPSLINALRQWNERNDQQRFRIKDLTSFVVKSDGEELLTSIDQVNNNYSSDPSLESSDRKILSVGQEFSFRIIILQVIGVAKEYRDVFCQFNFLHRFDEAFSTEPIKNTGSGPAPGFFRIQNVTVNVTQSFLQYLRAQPILFEFFGHYQQHPLDKESKDSLQPVNP